MKNLSGLKYFPSNNGSEDKIILPVFVGEVTGRGDSLEAALKDALEKCVLAEEFAAVAIRVRQQILSGG